jgi:hypothetical protein
MDDYDFNWDDVQNIDISGVGSSYDLEDVPFNFDFNLEDIPFNFDFGSSFNLEDIPFNFNEIYGDQPGDFPLTGNYGNPLAPGVQDAVADLLARNVLNDPFSTYDSPEDYSYEGSYGDPLAPGVKEAVEALFQENANVAAGNFPGTSGAPGLTPERDFDTVDDKDTKDGPNKDIPIKDVIKNLLPKKDNAALLAALLGGLLGLAGAPKVGGARGYQGKAAGTSPMTATRTALPTTGAPGAGGKRFLSDVTYAAEGGLMGLGYQPNQNVTFMAKGGLPSAAEYLAGTRGLRLGDNRNYDRLVGSGYSIKDALDVLPKVADKEMARGGLSSLGSYSDGGRMLKGPGDGMSDSIPANIEGKRPARLANDEFVVPADVVSHLGNGSSDAGAKVLYDMMAKVRKARTGNSKQGKQINPKKYVPA